MNEASEKSLASGIFGTVTTKRIIYQRSRGWFSGGHRTDIALAHLTSVSFSMRRYMLGAILLLLVGLIAFNAYSIDKSAGVLLFALFCVCLAILLLWGSPTVSINTSGRDTQTSFSWPWHRKEAEQFVEAVRSVIVDRS